ncbi:MAG: 50S ribosomal protein L28 [Phycisphaerales bacterium]|jgi:large subunit ribosomal protein L28|nr:50S ribosomal protein L28 [Phycisphaerales bacterium]
MPRVCHFTGRKTTTGRRIQYRGKPKYQGGIGLNISGVSKRTFKPNLQRVRAVVDGVPTRIRVSTKAIKQGLVVKPLKRKFGYTREQKLASGS